MQGRRFSEIEGVFSAIRRGFLSAENESYTSRSFAVTEWCDSDRLLEEQIVGFGDGRGKIPGAFIGHDDSQLGRVVLAEQKNSRFGQKKTGFKGTGYFGRFWAHRNPISSDRCVGERMARCADRTSSGPSTQNPPRSTFLPVSLEGPVGFRSGGYS